MRKLFDRIAAWFGWRRCENCGRWYRDKLRYYHGHREVAYANACSDQCFDELIPF